MLTNSANVWYKIYMNEEDVDETTGLMSGEAVTQSYEDNARSSRDRRPRRERENDENTDAVSKQARLQIKRKKRHFGIRHFILYLMAFGGLINLVYRYSKVYTRK